MQGVQKNMENPIIESGNPQIQNEIYDEINNIDDRMIVDNTVINSEPLASMQTQENNRSPPNEPENRRLPP